MDTAHGTEIFFPEPEKATVSSMGGDRPQEFFIDSRASDFDFLPVLCFDVVLGFVTRGSSAKKFKQPKHLFYAMYKRPYTVKLANEW